MNKIVIAYIKAGLRRMWGRSLQRRDAFRVAKVEYGRYRCESCLRIYPRGKVECDHKIAVGRFVGWDVYIERLFCDSNGLRILCKGCHKVKTASDRKSMSK